MAAGRWRMRSTLRISWSSARNAWLQKVVRLQPPDAKADRIGAKLLGHFRVRQQVQATAS